MRKTALMVLATLAGAAAGIQAETAAPRLVVGIVVDQLRTDYIENLKAHFGDHGFRMLMDRGVYMRDVDFKTSGLDAVSATAMLETGSYPAYTGVPAAYVIDRSSPLSHLSPALTQGSTTLTNDSFTPEALRLSTVADELAVDASGLARIYSVAADPQQAVILAGHAGTGAVWLNNTSGNWATTSYFGSLPNIVSQRNFRSSPSSKIDTMVWRPTAATLGVLDLPELKRKYPFRHTFPRADRDVYNKFSASALVNNEVTDVAIDLLRDLKLGTGNTPDMLNIAYTVAPVKYAEGNGRAELTDSYIRLDGQLERLFEAIDRYVGAGNALIWVSSTGYYNDAVIDDRKYRIPGGEFSVKRARSLLNSYLSARHGNAGYVEAIRDRHVYLDRKTIEDKRLDAAAVIEDAREFLSKMSGVADVYTIGDILSPATADLAAMRSAIDPRTAGDILIEYLPGWNVVDDEQYPPVTKTYRQTAIAAPSFILWTPAIEAQTIDIPVDATTLAPTIAGIMRIRSPNGARGKALRF